ncbi:hypothetical protein ACU8KH_03837 [Lachancea thermotolerans]
MGCAKAHIFRKTLQTHFTTSKHYIKNGFPSIDFRSFHSIRHPSCLPSVASGKQKEQLRQLGGRQKELRARIRNETGGFERHEPGIDRGQDAGDPAGLLLRTSPHV